MISTRRGYIAAGLGLLSAACGRRKGTGYAGYAVIATSGERSVAVVDLTRFRHVKDIALNAEPTAVVAGPNRHIFVLTPGTGSIHVLSPELEFRATHKLAEDLSGFNFSADGKYLAAISATKRELVVADARSLGVVRRYSLRSRPEYLSTGAADLAAVSTGDGGIELFALRSGERWQRQMPGRMGKLCFRADGQVLLAANLQARTLSVFSVPQLDLIAELPLAMQPDNLCFSADGGQLFVSGLGMDGVAIVFPYRVLQVDQTILAGRDPGVMAASGSPVNPGSPSYLFVASASGSDVSVLNIDNRRMVGLVDVAKQPNFITVTPDDQYALVLNESGDMAVIHITAIRQNGAVGRYKLGASLFTMLPVGERPVHALVVPLAI